MENEDLELEGKPAGNKDLWLFLIILDIVFLCVFGFFLYKHFFTGLFQIAPSTEASPVAQESVEQPEVIDVESSVQAVEMTAPEPVVETVQEPAPVVSEVQPKEVPLTEVLKNAKPEEPLVAAIEKSVVPEQKESIVIGGNPKSKYRKVTFRWFGEGKKVEIVSGFTMSKPQALKKKADHWETTLSIAPGTYKFLYVIDGENRRDPYAAEKDGRSLVEIK